MNWANRIDPRASRALLCGLLVVAMGLAAAGCGSRQEPRGAAAPTQPGFPLTITNCGQELTFEAPPKRAVTMDQVATEAMLGLELADSMAGTACCSIHPSIRPLPPATPACRSWHRVSRPRRRC